LLENLLENLLVLAPYWHGGPNYMLE